MSWNSLRNAGKMCPLDSFIQPWYKALVRIYNKVLEQKKCWLVGVPAVNKAIIGAAAAADTNVISKCAGNSEEPNVCRDHRPFELWSDLKPAKRGGHLIGWWGRWLRPVSGVIVLLAGCVDSISSVVLVFRVAAADWRQQSSVLLCLKTGGNAPGSNRIYSGTRYSAARATQG